MESFWKGTLSPSFSKSIGTVKFIPLSEMEEEDWNTLDYPLIRDRAKNRIADLVADGDLVGFFQINLFEKAKAKKRYYWPASRGMKRQYAESEPTDTAPFFKYEREVDTTDDSADLIEDLLQRLSNPILFPKRWLVRILSTALLVATSNNSDEPVSEEDLRNSGYGDYIYAAELLRKLIEAAKDGVITNKEIPWHQLLLIIIFLIAVYGKERVLEILDEVEFEDTNGRS